MESACRVYRPRDPGKTALWGLLDTLHERVKASRPLDGLRVVAGETVSVCPTEVVFALSGRLGERSDFTFQLTSSPWAVAGGRLPASGDSA